jgi:hypothetical protein
MNALKSLALLLLLAALVAGCKPAEKPAAPGTNIYLKTTWPHQGMSVEFTIPVTDDTLQLPPEVLQQRKDELIALHDRDAFFKAIEAASAVADAGKKIDLFESEDIAVELSASFAVELYSLQEKERLVPSYGNGELHTSFSHDFNMRPVVVKARDGVSEEERAKLEKALGEMKVYSLRHGDSEFLGYFAAKSEKEAIEDAVKIVIADAHVGMQFLRKAAQPAE